MRLGIAVFWFLPDGEGLKGCTMTNIKALAHIVPDKTYPGMWRVVRCGRRRIGETFLSFLSLEQAVRGKCGSPPTGQTLSSVSGRFFCLSEGELLHVARSITFRETGWGPAKVPTPIPDHFSLAPFNAVGERG